MISPSSKNYERNPLFAEPPVASPALGFGVHKQRTFPLLHANSCREFLSKFCEKGEEFKPQLEGAGEAACDSPWLTPVLGSGCAPGQVDAAALVKVIRGLGRAVDSMGSVSGEMFGCHAKEFAVDLVRERLEAAEHAFDEALRDGDEEDVPPLTAKILVLASLLTRLFHQVKTQTGAAPSRAGHDDAAYLDRDHLTDWLRLENVYVTPSLKILEGIANETSLKEIADNLTEKHLPSATEKRLEDFRYRVVERLKRHILRTKTSLQPTGDRRLCWSEVQWWAELLWLMIAAFTMRTERIAVYPGWTDLLLELCCYGDVEDVEDDLYPPIVGRPVFPDLSGGDDVIECKWPSEIMDKLQGEAGTVTRVHDAVARLLISQTSFRKPKVAQLGEPPVPSAFITSFDLELEIALLRQLKGGEEILIAFPVYLSNSYNGVAHTCWLALEVKRVNDLSRKEARAEQLERLMNPRPENFSALSSVDLKGKNCPVVVRLAGCPLITLPNIRMSHICGQGESGKAPTDGNSLSDQLTRLFSSAFYAEAVFPPEGGTRDDAVERIRSTLKLRHAIIVSEHTATLHNIIDLLHMSGRTGVADGLQRRSNPGLSSDVAVADKGWVRFWSLLGVQVGEGSIRQRLGTLLSVLPRDVGRSPPDTRIRGIAINRRITALEADFLAWNGLVVIRNRVDDCLQLIDKQIKNLTK